jgi:glycosyltransferase involved in cell wall biosynthesis
VTRKPKLETSVPSEGTIALILLNNSGMGGTERRFAQVYEGLRQRHVPVSLVINESLLTGLIGAGVLHTPSSGLVLKERFGIVARSVESLGWLGRVAHTLAFGLRKLDYAVWCVSVGRYLRRQRPKVMHLVLGGAYVALPLQMLGIAPSAVVSIVCPSLRGMVGSALGLALYRRALRSAYLVDALTESIREMVQQEGVPAEGIRVSNGSCVNTSRFHPAPVKRPWVVFSGRLVEEKNPLLFLEACARVHALVPDARFFLLGDGPLRTQVDAAMRRHGLESCTEVGWREQVETILSGALVFVSLQRTDNYPSQALLEAMACGAAVVATDVGLTGKLVNDRVGLLVKPTPDAVGNAIVTLLSRPEEAAILGINARERIIQDHSMETYLTYVARLYEDLCQHPAASVAHG